MPLQALTQLKLSVTDAGHLKISSFNFKFFNFKINFENGILGKILGLEENLDLDIELPLPLNILDIDGAVLDEPEFGQLSEYISNDPIDIDRGFYGFYVYTDIINPEYTGDTQTNLLRVVPVSSSKLYIQNYDIKPHYKTVCTQYITKIQILVTSFTGKEVIFPANTKSLCKLHFKRIK